MRGSLLLLWSFIFICCDGDPFPPSRGQPDFEVYPEKITFKNEGVCFQDTQQINIRNTGEAELIIAGPKVTGGTTPGEFSIDSADGFSLNAGEETTINVTYSPLDHADDRDTGMVTITSNDRDEKITEIVLAEEPRGTWNLFWIGVFEIHEPYEEGDPRIALRMETDDEYGCYNYGIGAEIEILGEDINVHISGIDTSGGCSTAFGPATHQSLMEVPQGEYSLTFDFTGLVDRYVLKVTDSSITVINEFSDFTRPAFNVSYRFPPNSLRYNCGTTTETSWMCDRFIELLQDEVDIQEFYFPDCGALPTWPGMGGAYYNMVPRHFYYQTEEDFDRAGEVLRSFGQNVIKEQQGILLELVNWRNKWYKTW